MHTPLSCLGAAAAALELACTELRALAAAASCGDGEECDATLAQRLVRVRVWVRVRVR